MAECLALVKRDFTLWQRLAHISKMPRYKMDVKMGDWELQAQKWLDFNRHYNECLPASQQESVKTTIIENQGDWWRHYRQKPDVITIKMTIGSRVTRQIIKLIDPDATKIAAGYLPSLMYKVVPLAGMCIGFTNWPVLAGAMAIPPWQWCNPNFVIQWTKKGAVPRDHVLT